MGQKLGADTEGAFHRELVQEIADRKEALRQILDSGIEADKGADLQKKIAAMDSAERIVDLVWHIRPPCRQTARLMFEKPRLSNKR